MTITPGCPLPDSALRVGEQLFVGLQDHVQAWKALLGLVQPFQCTVRYRTCIIII